MIGSELNKIGIDPYQHKLLFPCWIIIEKTWDFVSRIT